MKLSKLKRLLDDIVDKRIYIYCAEKMFVRRYSKR